MRFKVKIFDLINLNILHVFVYFIFFIDVLNIVVNILAIVRPAPSGSPKALIKNIYIF